MPSKVFSEWPGSILMAYMLPLCHLLVTLRYSQPNRPGLYPRFILL